MEIALTKDYSWVRTAAVAVAVTLGFAGLYFFLCMINPALAKSAMGGLVFGKTIRVANALRAFLLVSPFAVIGTGLGAHMFNVATGTALIWAAPFMPIAQTAVALAGAAWSKVWGRAWWKDLIVLGCVGFTGALLVSLNLTSFAILAAGLPFGKLLVSAVQFKLLVGTLTVMAGYPLVLLYDKTWGAKK